MRCKTCMFFVLKPGKSLDYQPTRVTTQDVLQQYGGDINKVPEKEIKTMHMPVERVLGRCRRKAPSLDGWPAVFEDDWCGEHKIDENKI